MSKEYKKLNQLLLKDTGYEIVGDELGRGGFAVVYKVRDKQNNKIYAGKFVKILPNATEKIKQYLRDTTKNEYILGKMLHYVCGDTYVDMVDLFPNVLLKDVNRDLFGLYSIIIMEYLEGVNLAEWIDYEMYKGKEYFQDINNYRYRVALGYSLAITIGNALKCMHNRIDYMHNDIKPENIFLSFKGETPVFKFLDFGLACEAVANSYVEPLCKNAGRVCVNTHIAGTLETLAPEAMECERNFIKSESWSLGVTIYELIFDEYVGEYDKDNDMKYLEHEHFEKNMKKLKSNFPPMWNILRNLIQLDTFKRWTMDDLLNYAGRNPEIQKVLEKTFNLK